MRAAFLFVVVPLACARRDARSEKAPTAVGGGPVGTLVSADEARTQIARARCFVGVACGDILEMDPCVTREEASLDGLPCEEVERAKLATCVERTRARACTDSKALSECAVNNICR